MTTIMYPHTAQQPNGNHRFVVEPIPAPKKAPGGKSKYDWEGMRAALIDAPAGSGIKIRVCKTQGGTGGLLQQAKRYGLRIVSRKQDDGLYGMWVTLP